MMQRYVNVYLSIVIAVTGIVFPAAVFARESTTGTKMAMWPFGPPRWIDGIDRYSTVRLYSKVSIVPTRPPQKYVPEDFPDDYFDHVANLQHGLVSYPREDEIQGTGVIIYKRPKTGTMRGHGYLVLTAGHVFGFNQYHFVWKGLVKEKTIPSSWIPYLHSSFRSSVTVKQANGKKVQATAIVDRCFSLKESNQKFQNLIGVTLFSGINSNNPLCYADLGLVYFESNDDLSVARLAMDEASYATREPFCATGHPGDRRFVVRCTQKKVALPKTSWFGWGWGIGTQDIIEQGMSGGGVFNHKKEMIATISVDRNLDFENDKKMVPFHEVFKINRYVFSKQQQVPLAQLVSWRRQYEWSVPVALMCVLWNSVCALHKKQWATQPAAASPVPASRISSRTR